MMCIVAPFQSLRLSFLFDRAKMYNEKRRLEKIQMKKT